MPSLDDAIGGVPPDPLDAAIDGVGQDNARLRTSLYGAVKQNPDEVARAAQLARKTGLPTPMVQRNLPQIEQRDALDSLDAAIDKDSAVGRKMTDAEFAAMAHDDVGTLSGVEALLKPPAVPALTPDYGFGQASQDLRREQDAQRAKLDAFFRPRSTISTSQGPAPSFGSVVSGLEQSFVQGAERATQGVRLQFADTFGLDEMAADAIKKRDRAQFRQDITTPAFESSTGAGLYGGGASLLQNLPGMLASIITRNPAPALAAAGVQTELDAYGRYRSRGATPGEAALGAGGEGLVEVGTEMIPLRTMLGAFGKPGSTAAKEFLKSQVQEQFGEQVATVLQDALDTAIANPNKTWGQYLAERPDAAYQTALATLVTSGVVTAGHVAVSKLAGEEARAAGAQRDTEVLAKMAQLATASKLRARDPKTFQDFVEAANENGPVQDIYLDARTLQQSGVDVAALAQASPAVAAQMQEAAATGGDIVIPMAEYAAKIAGTDLDAALVPHLRTSEDGLSLDEAQRFYQGQTDQFKAAAAQAMEEHATDEAFKTSAKEVETKLFDDLKQTGRFTDDVNKAYAILGRDFYVATAARLGITPTEMFSRYPLKMAVDRITGGQRMEQQTPPVEVTVYRGERKGGGGSGYQRNGAGRYYSSSKENAALYTIDPYTYKKTGKVLKEKITLRNPYRSDGHILPQNATPAEAEALTDRLIAEGHDGIIIDHGAGMNEYVVFDPAKVKSANVLAQSPKPNLAQRVMQAVTNALGVTQAQPEASADNGVAPLDMGQFFNQPAYHGSPYRFDKFTLDHIGKGEGAQAYGWGLYFAGKREVAEFYREALGKSDTEYTVDGAVQFRAPAASGDAREMAIYVLANGGTIENAVTGYEEMAADPAFIEAFKAAGEALKGKKIERVDTNAGQLYEVNIPEDGEYLLWDKPLSEQPEKVRAALVAARDFAEKAEHGGISIKRIADDVLVGEGLYGALERATGSPEAASRYLNSLGIAGIKYLDGTSRSQGEGSYNYVIFDENAVQILNTFYQGQGNRAEISFAKDITQTPSVITLFKNADLSSFLHEMGHFQLEVLAHIASQPNAPAEIVQDLDAVFKWFGITGAEQTVGGEAAGALGQGAVESDAFKAWFGDSKVVDADGKPLVVMHASTYGDITEFDKKEQRFGKAGYGFYFSDASGSNLFAEYGQRFQMDRSAAGEQKAVKTYPVYLSLKNPLIVDHVDDLKQYVDVGQKFGVARGTFGNLPPDAMLKLQRMGYDGIITRETTAPKVHKSQGLKILDRNDPKAVSSPVYVAFEPTQIKSAVGNRGTFDPNDPNILNQGDDATPKPTSLPPGRTPLEVWQAMSLEEKRPYHEQFARGFEAYLFEGKAPSAELNGVFARFRAWLVNVYKSVKALNVEINDEIRGVFDRLVATDEAIKQAEAARSMMPLFKSEEEMGDAELWAAYQRTGAQATEDAVSDLQRRGLRDMQWLNNARGRILKQLQRDAKAKRQAVGEEVKAEVRRTPLYAAQRFIRYGELPEANRTNAQRKALDATAGMPTKLDLGALKEMYGEGTAAPWRYLPTGKHGLAASEGVHPDLVAQVFGFTSGDQLVRDLLAATPEAEVIEGMTDQRVLERYGDLANPDTLARAADEAVHNEARARFVATELKALSKATGPVRAIAKAARDFAEATIARKKIKDIKPRQHAAAETRAAKAAEKAMAAGDTAAAAVEKRNQLVQNYSTRAAYDALDEIDKVVKYVNKFDNEGTRKNLDPDYLDQIDALRERFDFRKGVSNKDAAKRAKLAEWITAQEAQGFEPVISDALREEAFRTPYRELPLEELRGLVDAVKNIEHLGRLKKKLLTAADQRDFDAAVGDVVGAIKDNAKGSIAPQRSSDRSLVVKVKALFRHAAAIHRKFASLVREFDGFKDGGKAWEYLVRNMNDRGNFEAVENEKATVHLAGLLDTIKHVKLREKQYFESIGRSYSREERIGIALNMGNETNTERVLTGERLSPAQLQEVLDTLSKEETDFVQSVWDFIASYKPQMAEKERRLTGVEPQWVEPTPWVTKHGTYPGGYYPIAYDPLLDERSSADINAEVQRQLERGLYVRAQTRRGHLKERSESTGRPLRFDFGDVITRHVTQVVHDLAWHEYLIDANRLLRDPAIQQAIREHYGPEVYTELKDTLKDIAVGSAGTEKGAKFFNHLRYGTTIASLGFNVFNTLQNLTGITQSFSRVGTGWMLKGAVHWAGDAASMESSAKKIHAKSDFMRLRSKTMLREINDIRNKISGDTGKLQAVYFWLQNKTQLMVDVPTWWGAYEKAMAEDDMTESTAVALADQAVIDAQGSGQIKDLAGIQRGSSGLKLLTTFYSFFNTTFNLTAEAYGRTDFRKPGDVAMFTADMVLLYALPALLSTLLKAALRDDWDDPEALARKAAGDQISYLMGTVVGLRETGAGAQAAAGVGEGFGYSGPASLRFFSDFYQLGTQIHQGELDEAFWKSLNNEAGVLFHYPAGQINRTATGIAALLDGRTDNPAAVVMGAPPKQ